MTPTSMFNAEVADRASGRIGRDAYAILRTAAMAGLRQLIARLDQIDKQLRSEVLASQSLSGADLQVRQASIKLIGRATHFEAMTQLGVAVEAMTTLLLGWEAFRRGEKDCATPMLTRDLDLLKVLQVRERNRLTYWEWLGGRPSEAEMDEAALSPNERRILKGAARDFAIKKLRQFKAVRGAYTHAVHQVYLRYKHGYTLILPEASQLYLSLEDAGTDGEQIPRALENAFAVMHEGPDGRRYLHVVRSNDAQLDSTLLVARIALNMALEMATAWLWEVEHRLGRSVALSTVPTEIFEKWCPEGDPDYGIVTLFLAEIRNRAREPNA